MKDYINKEYIANKVKEIKKSSKNNRFYITKFNERDVILITLKENKDKRAIEITKAVRELLEGNCNQKELSEYIWNRYKAWGYKNIDIRIEKKKRPGLKKQVSEQFPNYEEMLNEIGISWTGFKTRVEKGMTFHEALTTPKIKPTWERARRKKKGE